MRWLRGAVSRFSNGRRHAARRRDAVDALASLDLVRLRAMAGEQARESLLAGSGLDTISRRVPVAVLATALGAPRGAEVAELVGVIAEAYFPGTGPDAPADEALVRLAHLLGDPNPQVLATTVMLLVQACDSTAGLIRDAARHLSGHPDPAGIDDLLAETLRHDPPVKAMRRVATERVTLGGVDVEAGAVVVLDLVAANRDASVFAHPDRFAPGRSSAHLTFGHGLRPCPGDHMALALAAGVLDALAEDRCTRRTRRTRRTARTAGGRDFGLFREMHHGRGPLVLPNAWDFASAAMLVEAGFAAVGTTSLGVAGAVGKPDAAGETREETVALARRLTGLPCMVTVDIEGGFGGNPRQVGDLAAELAAVGVVGVNLEDGRPDGGLAPVPAVQDLIAAIKAAVPDMFVNARTDTFWLGTVPATEEDPAGSARQAMVEEALARGRAYAEAGADGIFAPGVAEEGDIRALVGGVDVPVNVLFLPGRHTVKRLAELGVRRVSCGSLLFRAALEAAVTTALAVAEGEPVAAGLPTYDRIQALLTPRQGSDAAARATELIDATAKALGRPRTAQGRRDLEESRRVRCSPATGDFQEISKRRVRER
ncbi:hypothetical protein Misp02_33520 [Microtetraspora sp. NBRC 16547]|nr:hypothetical protein Misp02_33520 [Microtetraspora sp. NBRC 16547]